MKYYGSLNNRIDENCYFNGTKGNLKVGTHCTMYMYSDRHPYEIVKVDTQEHIFIREMDAKRVDKNGMSDCQSYEYTSNKNNREMELVLRNGRWFELNRYSKDSFKKAAERIKEDFKNAEIAYNYCVAMSGLSQKQIERIKSGKEVKKYMKINISFGIAEKYYDYSF